LRLARITVCTYNVHGFVGRDRRTDVDRIARVVSEIDPDVLGLQEVDCRRDGDALTRLAHATGLESIAGPTLGREPCFFGNALLTRFPVGDVVRLDISEHGREPRSLLDVAVAVGEIGVQCLVVHFGLQALERRRQAAAVCERVGAHGPAVLLGDLNEWQPRAGSLHRLRSILGPGRGVRSYPAGLPLLALDWVWVRPSVALLDVRAHRTPLASVASDHLPVVGSVDVEALEFVDAGA
jgi:endonuclease/exonuclease/phosphatase family metal-dependent hydrolase